MGKDIEIRNQTQDSYSGPRWVDEIRDEVLAKLGRTSFKPDSAGLKARVDAWQRAKQPSRPETMNITADGRPVITIDPSASGLRPEQTEQVGNKIVPRQPVEAPWMEGFEWNQAAIRMAGHFDRNRIRAIYTEPLEELDSAPGPGISNEQPRSIGY